MLLALLTNIKYEKLFVFFRKERKGNSDYPIYIFVIKT